MTVRFAPRAVRNLRAISYYLSAHDPKAADRVRTAILGSIDNLALFPEMGRMQVAPGVRKVIVRKYPYIVYYTLHGSDHVVTIIAIRHPSQDRLYRDS